MRRAMALALICLLSTTWSALAWSVAPAVASPNPAVDYYVSVGDSYAAGYQPVAAAMTHRHTPGFAYQGVDPARARG